MYREHIFLATSTHKYTAQHKHLSDMLKISCASEHVCAIYWIGSSEWILIYISRVEKMHGKKCTTAAEKTQYSTNICWGWCQCHLTEKKELLTFSTYWLLKNAVQTTAALFMFPAYVLYISMFKNKTDFESKHLMIYKGFEFQVWNHLYKNPSTIPSIPLKKSYPSLYNSWSVDVLLYTSSIPYLWSHALELLSS